LLLGRVEKESPELVRLHETFKEVHHNHDLSRLVVGERVAYLEAIQRRSSPLPLTIEYDAWMSGQPPEQWRVGLDDVRVLLYRMFGFGDRDLLSLLGVSRKLEAAANSVEDVAGLLKEWNRFQPEGVVPHYWVEMFLVHRERTYEEWVEIHARLRATDAAFAVTRFRFDHEGNLPDSLEALIPEYFEAIPTDPESGKPFELITTTEGFGIGRGTALFNVRIEATRNPGLDR
jgi:hypothetical protein